MAHAVTVYYREAPTARHEDVLGWHLGEPDGFLQLIMEETVVFIALADVSAVVVPNLISDHGDPEGAPI